MPIVDVEFPQRQMDGSLRPTNTIALGTFKVTISGLRANMAIIQEMTWMGRTQTWNRSSDGSGNFSETFAITNTDLARETISRGFGLCSWNDIARRWECGADDLNISVVV